MDYVFKNYLFTKQVLVSDFPAKNPAEVVFLLAKYLGIKITKGAELADSSVMLYASQALGQNVPEPFYRNFPQSVQALAPFEKFFDQLIHYATTYDSDNFDSAGYSLFEKEFERAAFSEHTEIKYFEIVSEEGAVKRLFGFLDDMLKNSRPLSEMQYGVLEAAIKTYAYEVKECASKNTALRLTLSFRDETYARFTTLSDVIKLVEMLNFQSNRIRGGLKQLNLCNKDRKFISAVIDKQTSEGKTDIINCYEKKEIWCGLLHHLHYKPKNKAGEEFITAMRAKKGNLSVYSAFEKFMAKGDVRNAAGILKDCKGNGALLRNLNYILSRCNTFDDKKFVLELIEIPSPLLAIQLYMQYSLYKRQARTFRFYCCNMLEVHTETVEEQKRRKSELGLKDISRLTDFFKDKLAAALHERLGSVYISEKMYDVALPLQENTSNGGYGVLPKGSRLHIGADQKVRAFIYWEKVNDIDLSVIGLCNGGGKIEFSWRTMAAKREKSVVFSGDETSGYHGGSEYFDIDLPKFRKEFGEVRYLVFNANVFSAEYFSDCVCRAGFMLRERKDSGEIYEPKTVKSSFTINCRSLSAHLFGIDVTKGDFIWLNTATASGGHIAGEKNLNYLTDYFQYAKFLDLGTLFEMMASQITDKAEEADVALTDEEVTLKEGAEQIHSYDFEKVMALLK